MKNNNIHEQLKDLRNEALDIILEKHRNDFMENKGNESPDSYSEKVKAETEKAYNDYLEQLHRGYKVIVDGLKASSTKENV